MTATIETDSLLTEREAEQFLRLAKNTLTKWRCVGRGGPAFVRVGRTIRYRRSSLERYLDANTIGAASR